MIDKPLGGGLSVIMLAFSKNPVKEVARLSPIGELSLTHFIYRHCANKVHRQTPGRSRLETEKRRPLYLR